jgi:hypothetical protein
MAEQRRGMLERAVSGTPSTEGMPLPARTASCPNCGAPIEFKLGSSAGCVCPYCRFSVVRTGEALEAIGKVADLVPTAPRLTVGDQGTVDGRPFTVGGRLQLDHGSGPWDEWYVELEPGRWGWLAYAQGRSYITFPQDTTEAPPYGELSPGTRIKLAGFSLEWTVTEIGQSRLVSAEGELPLPATPGERSRYADLSGPNGLFGTIDYGSSSADAPHIYVGRNIPEEGIKLTRAALGPRPEQRVETERLRCPTCGGPIKLLVPGQSERATCPSCRAILDVDHGTLSAVGKLDRERMSLAIPIGSEGTLCGEKVIVVGMLERTTSDGYSWNEYLLYAGDGYRWLVEDSRHFTYVRELPASDVSVGIFGPSYQGKTFRRFQHSVAKVTYVIGELYWKARVGDSSRLEDFVRPPQMLSKEETAKELHWSIGTYVPARDVWKGLKLKNEPLEADGVGTCQPNPVQLGYLAAVGGLLIMILIVLGIIYEGGTGKTVASVPLKLLPGGQAAAPDETVVYTERFEIERTTTLAVELDTNVSNSWVSVAAALIDDDTNEVRELYINAEYWGGVTDGESWTEGDPKNTEYLGKVRPGRYVMRLDAQWGRDTGTAYGDPPQATVNVSVGKRSIGTFFLALLAIAAPLILAVVRKMTFESRRWSNSNVGQD